MGVGGEDGECNHSAISCVLDRIEKSRHQHGDMLETENKMRASSRSLARRKPRQTDSDEVGRGGSPIDAQITALPDKAGAPAPLRPSPLGAERRPPLHKTSSRAHLPPRRHSQRHFTLDSPKSVPARQQVREPPLSRTKTNIIVPLHNQCSSHEYA